MSLLLKGVGKSNNINSNNAYVFKALTKNISGVPPMDGSQVVSFNGETHLLGGWDPMQRYNTHFKSADGVTFTSVATMNFSMHIFGAADFNNGTEIWTWGADPQLGTSPIQKYTTATGWVTISADVSGSGFGTRLYYAAVKYTVAGVEYMYALGGQTDDTGATMLYSVVRAPISNPTNWQTVGNLPAGYYASGSLVSYNGSLIFMGGAKYNNGVMTNFNSSIYESTDNGANWILANTLPTIQQSIFPNVTVFDNKIFFINGYNVSNKKGIYHTADKGANWTQLYDSPEARHATGFSVIGNKLAIVTGNLFNDSYQITKESYANILPSGISLYYGVWKNAGYTGACLRAKNTTTLIEQDIYFVSGFIDTAALLTLAGANSVTVKLYDQSGNANHQTNFSGLIVTAGVLNTSNGKATVYYNGAETATLNAVALGTNYAVFLVINIASQSREFIGGGLNNYMIYQDATFHYCNVNGLSSSLSRGAFGLASQSTVSYFRDNKIVQVYQNGINGGNRDFDPMELSSNNPFTVTDLMGEGAPYLFQGDIQLVVFYNSNQLNQKQGIENYINSLI